ncbi:ependymin [Megalops cyprinoides]|uniref:ependymin n=1 Tax=Megalops cyprinoides TaxID=118141 RepID=UPI00186486CB|nr:ependymin [Megalops cyprinoides]
MQHLILLSLCLLLAASAQAQKPHPCKSPPLMVGRISVTYPKEALFAYERFTYDALGQRVRVRAEGLYQNRSFHDDLLMLFREEVMYEISYRNHSCKKRALKAPFQPIQIPRDAELQAQVIVGSSSGPGQGLLVNNWIGEVPETEGKYFMTFTEFGCLPITSLYYTDKTGWILTSFFDLVIGIEDPQEFFPPEFCATSAAVEEGDVVTDFFQALLRRDDDQ